MLSYCVSGEKIRKVKTQGLKKQKTEKIMLSSNFRFTKEQEASGFLTGLVWVESSSVGIPILGNAI